MHNIMTSVLVRVTLLLAFGLGTHAAQADNNTLYVAPGPATLLPPDITKRSEQLGGTHRKLGDLIGNSLESAISRATDLIVTTKCGHYQSATITYADGSAKTLNLSNAPASQKDIDQAKAAIPLLRIVDLGGCDG